MGHIFHEDNTVLEQFQQWVKYSPGTLSHQFSYACLIQPLFYWANILSVRPMQEKLGFTFVCISIYLPPIAAQIIDEESELSSIQIILVGSLSHLPLILQYYREKLYFCSTAKSISKTALHISLIFLLCPGFWRAQNTICSLSSLPTTCLLSVNPKGKM